MRLNFTFVETTISPVTDVLRTIITVGGWVGAAEFLVAYMLVSRNKIAGDSLRYQALNISASILLMVNCMYTGAWPSAISNIFFLAIGISIVVTVKRAYVAQLARRRRQELASMIRRRSHTLDREAPTTMPAMR